MVARAAVSRRGLTRRGWAALVGAGAVSLACGDNVRIGRRATLTVLEPDAEGCVIAIRAQGVRETMVVITDEAAVVSRTPLVLAADGGHGALVVRGLAPATEHWVHVEVRGEPVLGPNRFRTAPRVDDPRPVRLVVSADFDPAVARTIDLIETVVAADPDVFVMLGDFPYVDDGPVPMTATEFRLRYAYGLATSRMTLLREAMALRVIYDDHEVRNDWDATTAVAEPARTALALAIWDEVFPLATLPAADDPVRYRAWRQGAHLECFLLDARRFRSANAAPDDGAKTLLGAPQLAWLLAAVRASTAPFKVIFTSVPLDFGLGVDGWHHFLAERATLFAALVGVPGILFVSADQHWFAANVHAQGIREFQCGPLARAVQLPPPPLPGVHFTHADYNVCVLDVDADRLVVTGLGPGNARFFEAAFTAADLTPR